jgi:hypothetical protein
MTTKNTVSPEIRTVAAELVDLTLSSKITERRIENLRARILSAAIKEIHVNGTVIKCKAEKYFSVIAKGRIEDLLRNRKLLSDDVLDGLIAEAAEIRRAPRYTKIVFGKTHLKKIREALQAHGISNNTAHGDEDSTGVPQEKIEDQASATN